MPQPALHLLIGRQQLARWADTRTAPFDIHDAAAVNAFLHGTLAPDMGNFPGGSNALAHAVHTVRTADTVRALYAAAITQAETAFALGWLSHVLADVEIHPLINAAAARRSAAAGDRTHPQPHVERSLIEHVRVEVGIDVRFCCETPLLEGVRLRRAFDHVSYGFLATVVRDVLRVPVTSHQLSRMERGLILFSHAALGFARGAARTLCWNEAGPKPSPSAALVWHAATRLSGSGSVVHAYLKPYAPDTAMMCSVQNAIDRVHAAFHHYEHAGLHDLPSYDLETGALQEGVRSVA